MHFRLCSAARLSLVLALTGSTVLAQERRIALAPQMIQGSSALADFASLADEQDHIGDPPHNAATNGWKIPSPHWKEFP